MRIKAFCFAQLFDFAGRWWKVIWIIFSRFCRISWNFHIITFWRNELSIIVQFATVVWGFTIVGMYEPAKDHCLCSDIVASKNARGDIIGIFTPLSQSIFLPPFLRLRVFVRACVCVLGGGGVLYGCVEPFYMVILTPSLSSLGSVWTLKNLGERKKFRRVTFFLMFGLENITKKKNIKEN